MFSQKFFDSEIGPEKFKNGNSKIRANFRGMSHAAWLRGFSGTFKFDFRPALDLNQNVFSKVFRLKNWTREIKKCFAERKIRILESEFWILIGLCKPLLANFWEITETVLLENSSIKKSWVHSVFKKTGSSPKPFYWKTHPKENI